MKKLLLILLSGISAMTLFTGCLALQLGPDSVTKAQSPTLGQQLCDLQKAKDSGVINETEYQAQKAKLFSKKP